MCVCVIIYNSNDLKRRSYEGKRFGEQGKELGGEDY